jgi:hypothetical protein
MPVQTSVITGTVAHKHSATGGSSDGGKLATGGLGSDTSFDLSNGSLTYSNGTSLVELTAGGAGESLQISGGLPTWQAGGADFSKIASGVYSSGDNITLSFSAVPQTDVSYFRVVFNGTMAAGTNTTHFNINGLTSNYKQYGSEIIGGSQTLVNASGGTDWYIEGNAGGTMFTIMDLVCNTNTDNLQMILRGSGDLGYTSYTGINTTASQTSLSSVKVFDNNAGATLGAGSTLSVYKINL